MFFRKRITGKNKHTESISDHILTLPANFADDILEYEMKIDSPEFTIKDVNYLLQLYTRGVDYHVSIMSNKYQHFKKKMMNLMMNPRVMEVMELAKIKKEKELLIKKAKRIEKRSRQRRGFSSPNRRFQVMNKLSKKKNDPRMHKLKQKNRAKEIQKKLEFLNIREQDGRKKIQVELKRQEFKLNMDMTKYEKFDDLKKIVQTHQADCAKKDFMIQNNLKDQLEKLKDKLTKRKGKAARRSRVSSITEYTKEAVFQTLYANEYVDNESLKKLRSPESEAKSCNVDGKSVAYFNRASSMDLANVENAKKRYGKFKDNLETGDKLGRKKFRVGFLEAGE